MSIYDDIDTDKVIGKKVVGIDQIDDVDHKITITFDDGTVLDMTAYWYAETGLGIHAAVVDGETNGVKK